MSKNLFTFFLLGNYLHTTYTIKVYTSLIKNSKRATVSFYFHQDGGGGDNVPTERRRPTPRLLDEVLKPRVVQQQLRQDLLQDLHAVAEVCEVEHHVIIYLLHSSFPI